MRAFTSAVLASYLAALISASFTQGAYAAVQCTVLKNACVEGPGTKKIGGYDVYRECWRWEKQVSCTDPTVATDAMCETYRAKGCYEIASSCINNAQGECVAAQKKYRCDAPSGTYSTSCAVQTFCMDGSCFDTGYPANGDMPQAVGNLEAMRQAGRYFDPDKGVFFDGEEQHCREGWGGLKSCCDIEVEASTGRPSTSNQVAFKAIMSTAKYGYDYAKFKATPYVQDVLAKAKAMINGAQATSAATSTAAAGSGAAASAPAFNFSFMGFGWTSGGAAAVQAGEVGSHASAIGSNGFYFDPVSFGIAIAVMLVMEAMSCEPEEQQLGIKRGNSLCFKVGDNYCSKEVLGSCMEKSQGFCCFNSKLAKLVNKQGKEQLGVSLGTAEAPNCNGFTLDDFKKIDMGKMDLSEFLQDIVPDEYSREGVHEDSGYWQQRASDRMEKAGDFQTPDVSYDPANPGGTP